jgi:virulence-associated protein VapD
MSNNERMYAIVFDLDTDKLKALYHNTSWNNAYKDIEKVLVKKVLKGNRNQYILEIKIR